jgi:2',3'-cyclic-nucleotide 2'-phosphodiesterase (5'-nucleotidase family)
MNQIQFKHPLSKILSVIAIGLTTSTIYMLSSCAHVSYVDYADVITLNDFHGQVEDDHKSAKPDVASSTPGLLRLATTIDKCKYMDAIATGSRNSTYVINNGDIVQGAAFSNLTHGQSTLECLSSLGIEYSSIGNHEFD